MTILKILVLVLCASTLLPTAPAFAQTPDGETPALEEACDKYAGEGARHGLCVAYCEAQDCDRTKKDDQSCERLAERFAHYSFKQGYVTSPKLAKISCSVSVCSEDDVQFCGGAEKLCGDETGACVELCSMTFAGFDGDVAVCNIAKCSKCVAEQPTK